MKPLPLLTLTLSLLLPIHATLLTSIQQISTRSTLLNRLLSTWEGDTAAIFPIIFFARRLKTAITDATQEARDSAELTVPEAVDLAFETRALVETVTQTLRSFADARPIFSRFNLNPVILMSLENQREVSHQFGEAVMEKVPENMRAAALALMMEIDTSFETTVEAFHSHKPEEGGSLVEKLGETLAKAMAAFQGQLPVDTESESESRRRR